MKSMQDPYKQNHKTFLGHLKTYMVGHTTFLDGMTQ